MVKIGRLILNFFDKMFKTKNPGNRTLIYNKKQDQYNTNLKQWDETNFRTLKNINKYTEDPKKFAWNFEPEFDNILKCVEPVYDVPKPRSPFTDYKKSIGENVSFVFKDVSNVQESEEHIYEEIPDREYVNFNNELNLKKADGDASSGYYTEEDDNEKENLAYLYDYVCAIPEDDRKPFSFEKEDHLVGTVRDLDEEYDDSGSEDSYNEDYCYDLLENISDDKMDKLESKYDEMDKLESKYDEMGKLESIYENIPLILEDPESLNFDSQEIEGPLPIVELFDDEKEVSVFNEDYQSSAMITDIDEDDFNINEEYQSSAIITDIDEEDNSYSKGKYQLVSNRLPIIYEEDEEDFKS